MGSATSALPNFYRVLSDTPNADAFAVVAAGVRFSFFEIFDSPTFCFAIDFSSRTSSRLHSRRVLFFLATVFTAFAVVFDFFAIFPLSVVKSGF